MATTSTLNFDIDSDINDIVVSYIKSSYVHTRIPKDVQFLIIMYYWIKNTLVYVIGNNKQGQLGLGHYDDVNKLTIQKHQYQIRHIYNAHGYIIYSDYKNKNCYTSGYNENGECCLGHYHKINKLKKIKSFSTNNIKIKHIFTNITAQHTFWMDIKHNIYGNGYNEYHQLGLNDNINQSKGIQIKYFKNICDIQCGTTYTFALDYDNNLYSTGFINNKQVKQFTKMNNINIIKIRTGYAHCLFISVNYSLYSSGDNDCGSLGLGHTNNEYVPVIIDYFQCNNIKIIEIECGYYHNLCIDSKYNIYSFGYNKYAQCGLGFNDENILIPNKINMLQNEQIISIKCGSFHSYCLSLSNNHYLWGSNYNNECVINKNKTKIIQSPYLVFNTQLNNKRIKEIFLGDCNTQIIVIDD